MVSQYPLVVPTVSGRKAENDGRNRESPSTVVRSQIPNTAGAKRDVSVMCSGHILNVWISHWICIPKQLAWLAIKTQTTRPLKHSDGRSTPTYPSEIPVRNSRHKPSLPGKIHKGSPRGKGHKQSLSWLS